MDQVKSQTTEVLASLDRRTREIMGNSSELGVLKDGQVQTELLHKARMRIAVQLQQCLASPGDTLNFDYILISEYEIDRAALTIARAMVNPKLQSMSIGMNPFLKLLILKMSTKVREIMDIWFQLKEGNLRLVELQESEEDKE
ncbi:hypothetical protein C8R48DRAFT_677852 [Suillus tomentosus]|nr:hypothetical protein C8R48DRAFT_677852 [Suillus tomentosus]